MSLNINNYNGSGQSCVSITSPKHTDNIKDTQESDDKNKDTQKTHKKKHVVSEKDGKYYCTYMVDDEGQKLLINKVPISQVSGQNDLLNSTKFNNTELGHSNVSSDAQTNIEYKRQLDLESTHKKNIKGIMNILSGNNIQSNNNELNKILMTLRI